MAMRIHEVHPALVHAPIALLPVASITDLAESLRASRRSEGAGRVLWWATAAAGLAAGVSGLAASQQAHAPDEKSERMMWLHGVGNLIVVGGATAIALWRTRHRASLGLSVLGLAATALSTATAYLGGEMVYEHGVGVTPVRGGVGRSPGVLTAAAWKSFFGDAWRGLGWLLRRPGSEVRRGEVLRAAAEPAPGDTLPH